MARNDAAATGHVCPGIRIQVIDMVQPPGIGIPMADMDADQEIVSVVLAAKSSTETPTKARCGARPRALAGELSRPMVAPRDSRHRDVGGDESIHWWLSYSSWRRYQTPARRSPNPRTIISLRPRGARSSHWYMPQRSSSPRVYAEYVW